MASQDGIMRRGAMSMQLDHRRTAAQRSHGISVNNICELSACDQSVKRGFRIRRCRQPLQTSGANLLLNVRSRYQVEGAGPVHADRIDVSLFKGLFIKHPTLPTNSCHQHDHFEPFIRNNGC